jgi:threonine dehydratase
VVGAQVEGVDVMRRRLRGDEELAPRPTLADGLAVGRPGERTSAICRRLLDDIGVVTEDEVRRTIAELALGDKLIVEGAGAVAVAALARVRGERRVAVISEGNLELPALSEVSRPFTARPAELAS